MRAVLDSRRLRRGRDADPPADLRRRGGAAVHDLLQRVRARLLPAHRRRALPEAADRRRPRAGVRDRARTSGTRACRSSTTPSSRCSSGTRPTATTRSGCTRVEERVIAAAAAAPAGSEIDLTPPWPRSRCARRSASTPASIRWRDRDRDRLRRPHARGRDRHDCGRDLGRRRRSSCSRTSSSRRSIRPTFLDRLPGRDLAARQEPPRDPALVERFEAFCRDGARERVHGAERPRRPARAVRGAGRAQAPGEEGRRRLRAGARVRDAADGRRRHRHRPAA